jgi:cobalamin biosynthesis protein CobD/CbiB
MYQERRKIMNRENKKENLNPRAIILLATTAAIVAFARNEIIAYISIPVVAGCLIAILYSMYQAKTTDKEKAKFLIGVGAFIGIGLVAVPTMVYFYLNGASIMDITMPLFAVAMLIGILWGLGSSGKKEGGE